MTYYVWWNVKPTHSLRTNQDAGVGKKEDWKR